MPTEVERRQAERLASLEAMRITTQTVVSPEQPILTVDGVGFFALDDIHAVKAKQKAGKTTALKVMLAALLSGSQFRLQSGIDDARVLYMDTEQKASDTKLILDDVAQMTGLDAATIDDRVMLYGLRRRNYDQLLDDLCVLVEHHRPQVVIIDGIVEFVASFNDEALAKQLIHDLLCLSEQSHLAIVCVLHTNKADEDHNMRGHLGTMLAQKAGTVLECKKDKGSSVITVSCADARHEEAPEWSIMYDEQGHIIDADEQRRQLLEERRIAMNQKRQETVEKEKQERLEQCLRTLRDKGGVVSRKQLTEILMKVLQRKRPTVSTYITEWLNDKAIVEVNGMIQSSEDLSLAF